MIIKKLSMIHFVINVSRQIVGSDVAVSYILTVKLTGLEDPTSQELLKRALWRMLGSNATGSFVVDNPFDNLQKMAIKFLQFNRRTQHAHMHVDMIMVMSTSMWPDHRWIEVDCGLCQPVFNKSETGILFGGMTKPYVCTFARWLSSRVVKHEHRNVFTVSAVGQPIDQLYNSSFVVNCYLTNNCKRKLYILLLLL